MAKLVMPGLVPGIHVLTACQQEERGWPGQAPAMTKKATRFQAVSKSPKMPDAIRSGWRIAKDIGVEIQANFVLRADKVIE